MKKLILFLTLCLFITNANANNAYNYLNNNNFESNNSVNGKDILIFIGAVSTILFIAVGIEYNNNGKVILARF